MIADYKLKRRKEGAAPATLNYELGVLSQAFDLAINEWEWCKGNPVKRVSRERVRNQIERWLTPKEEADLLKASPPWLQELIVFSLYTGLRQAEVLNLKWPQVDLFRKTITLLEQKNGSKSTLPLNEKALDVLKGRAKVGQTGYVFKTRKRKQLEARNVLRSFFKARDEAGLTDFRWHDLRHSWASRLVQEGCDIYVVQRLGRWKSISMVERYAHHNTRSLRKGIELLGCERPSDLLTHNKMLPGGIVNERQSRGAGIKYFL
jgi:integrase